MAHKKAGGSTVYGRDSRSQRLGVKIQDGGYAKIGSIIIRQRGTKYRPGKNVKKGKDDTLFSVVAGLVTFTTKKFKNYTGKLSACKLTGISGNFLNFCFEQASRANAGKKSFW